VLGDIVNGRPAYVSNVPPFKYADPGYQEFKASNLSRKKAVYLAANDGMLHAFGAQSGQELWAYVPSFVLPNLISLADKNYSGNHRYYVDGSPVPSDVYDPASGSWRTLLVGGLNDGGRGYYALDVTDPDNPKALWEFSNANVGLTYGNPIISKLINGTWIVAVTSGYNNVNPGDGVGRLFLLNANSGALLDTISTGVGSPTTPSGLGKITAWVNDSSIIRYSASMAATCWATSGASMSTTRSRRRVKMPHCLHSLK
jgi:type IV pilus assembly protein PilY1